MQAVEGGAPPSSGSVGLDVPMPLPLSPEPQRGSCSRPPSGAPAEPDQKSGWCLKKGKTEKPWGKAHHSQRYFVSRGQALCYFERAAGAESELGGSRLLGIVDLREVVRIRRSADATAPEHAIDIVLRGRTYVLVPQPPTADEVSQWVRIWAQAVRPGGIESELREAAQLPEEMEQRRRDSMYGMSANFSFRGSVGRMSIAAPDDGDAEAAGVHSPADADGSPLCSAWQTPEVLLQGYLHKMPVRSDHRKGLRASLLQLSEMASWRRRYFQLRSGMLQWYRDDPGVGGEFLGVLRLTRDTTVELEKDKLRVTSSGETLVLRGDDSGERLTTWEADVSAQVARMRESGQGEVQCAGGVGTLDLDDL
mmetsp:Transcript_20088/g.51111  ORF Transcript_20088/g.51111 Transcript_20088/m.51111 type:complete len:365 (-) Transcript_20088:130-1224(-)